MPRPYVVPIVSDFVATPLRSGALVLSTISSSLFTILLDTKELSDPVSKIVLGTTIVLALSGAIILVFIVITSLADLRFTMPIPAGIHKLSSTCKLSESSSLRIRLDARLFETTLIIGCKITAKISLTLSHIFSRVFIERKPFSWLSIGSLNLTNSAFIALYTDITVSLGTALTNDSTIIFKTNWKISLIMRFLSSWDFFISGFFLLDASFFFSNHNIYESRYQNHH